MTETPTPLLIAVEGGGGFHTQCLSRISSSRNLHRRSRQISSGGSASVAGPTVAEELPTPVGDLAAVEGRPPAICGTAEAGRARRLGRSDGRQRARPVEAGEFTGFGDCTAQFLPRLAQDSEIDWPTIAQPAEPPDADPHVRWCARGGAARLPPIPIPNFSEFLQFEQANFGDLPAAVIRAGLLAPDSNAYWLRGHCYGLPEPGRPH